MGAVTRGTVKIVVTVGLVAVGLGGLAACGGGGGGGGGGGQLFPIGTSSGNSYTAGVYMPSSQFKGLCAAPRAGNVNDRLGHVIDENLWLRSWTNELYLWYAEVQDRDPGNLSTASYFPLLKTAAKTASGADKDKFHFTWNTADYQAFVQSGTSAGYGIEFTAVVTAPPRRAVVAYTHLGSPGAQANVQRGAEVVTVDGVDFVNGSNVAVINAGLFPAAAGETHTLVFRNIGTTATQTVSLTSANVTLTPVQNVKTLATGSGLVGYLQFNDHIATAESQLISAINTLRAASITNLVLDIRYNGGGYLDIASELAYMIGGTNTNGFFFERTQFNDKNPLINPVTRLPLTPTPFHKVAQGFSTPANTTLPTLNLSKVYVLTGPDSCSASESIINGLAGAGVQVIQIGSATCGKPYGFYPQDNCGTTYFSIQFKGVNAAGFGDYSDGFSPLNNPVPTNATLPGCSVADDYSHALGDPLEARLATALNLVGGGSCPAASGLAPKGEDAMRKLSPELEAVFGKSPLRENRWYR